MGLFIKDRARLARPWSYLDFFLKVQGVSSSNGRSVSSRKNYGSDPEGCSQISDGGVKIWSCFIEILANP